MVNEQIVVLVDVFSRGFLATVIGLVIMLGTYGAAIFLDGVI